MAHLSVLKTSKVVYAFPGMGKTPYALNPMGPWVDLDFGYFRTAFKVEKEKESVLYKPYVRLVAMITNDGFKVLSNSPETIRYMAQAIPRAKISMVLPSPSSLSYSAKKLGISEETAAEWVADWAKIASDVGINIFYTTRGFDNFMRRVVY